VGADAGKSALMYGPFVYCLEEADNGKNLPSLAVAAGLEVTGRRPLSELPGGMPVLEYPGYRLESGVEGLYGTARFRYSPVRLAAVPYCLWCNRKTGEMLVWQKVRI